MMPENKDIILSDSKVSDKLHATKNSKTKFVYLALNIFVFNVNAQNPTVFCATTNPHLAISRQF